MKSGEFLSDKRIEKGISVAELARTLKVSEDEIEHWEAGELPDSEHLLELSALLNVSVEDILRGGRGNESKRTGEDGSETAENTRRCESDELRRGKPKRSAPSESYYEKLHKKIRYSDDPSSADYAVGGSGYNGFSRGERKFGYILCAVAAILLIVSSAYYLVLRHGDISVVNAENYHRYMDVRVRKESTGEYSMNVTAKKSLRDVRVEAELTFDAIFGEENYTCTVTVVAQRLDVGESASTAFAMPLSNYSPLPHIAIRSAEGGI